MFRVPRYENVASRSQPESVYLGRMRNPDSGVNNVRLVQNIPFGGLVRWLKEALFQGIARKPSINAVELISALKQIRIGNTNKFPNETYTVTLP